MKTENTFEGNLNPEPLWTDDEFREFEDGLVRAEANRKKEVEARATAVQEIAKLWVAPQELQPRMKIINIRDFDRLEFDGCRLTCNGLLISGDDDKSEAVLQEMVTLLNSGALSFAKLSKVFSSGEGSVYLYCSLEIKPDKIIIDFYQDLTEKWLKRFRK